MKFALVQDLRLVWSENFYFAPDDFWNNFEIADVDEIEYPSAPFIFGLWVHKKQKKRWTGRVTEAWKGFLLFASLEAQHNKFYLCKKLLFWKCQLACCWREFSSPENGGKIYATLKRPRWRLTHSLNSRNPTNSPQVENDFHVLEEKKHKTNQNFIYAFASSNRIRKIVETR